MNEDSGLTDSVKKQFRDKITELPEFRGEHTWKVQREDLLDVLGALRSEARYNLLIDICSLDHSGQEPRFEMVYELCNLETQEHLRIKTPVPEGDCRVPSVVGLWKTANWHEREVYDMMGIKFEGHPELKRILMWDGYPFYPLRKEFPLEGKETNMPDIAFSRPAPLEGGPFVTCSSDSTSKDREPRSKAPVFQ